MCNFPRVTPIDEADAILKVNLERFLADIRSELTNVFNSCMTSGHDVAVISPTMYFMYRHVHGLDSKMNTIAEEFKEYLKAAGYKVTKCLWNCGNEQFIIWVDRKKVL